MNYPQRPQTQNGYQALGQLLGQGGQLVGQYADMQTAEEDRQLKLQALRQDMIEKRTAAAMAKIKADREAKMEAEKESRAAAAAEYAKGEIISPTLANQPSLAQSSRPLASGGPTQSEVDGLTLKEDQLPNQNIAGSDSTALMGAALDRMIGSGTPGRIPRTREQILQNQLENRQLPVKDWVDATKTIAITGNRANPEIARAIRDDLVSAQKLGKPLSRDDMRAIILRNDPDGTFMGTREGAELLSSSNTASAIKNADIAASRLSHSNEQFGINTNIKLKEAVDNDPYIKPYAVADRKYTQTQAVYDKYKKNGNPAFVDRTLVVNFNKMIDETSAVMGGEVEATIKEMGVSDRLLGKIRKWAEGGAGFTDEERDQIMSVMGELHNKLKEKAQNAYYTARGTAKDLGADPDIVTGLYRPLFEQSPGRYTKEYAETKPPKPPNPPPPPQQKRRVWNPATGRVE